MKKYDVVIGIDPDVDKSGVAFLIVESRIIEVSNLTFANLLDYLRETRDAALIAWEYAGLPIRIKK